jgi:hypothetical protein
MTETFNDALSMLKIWFFDASRMIPGYTSITHDVKGLSLCTWLQALDRIAYSIQMARRFLIPRILSIYVIFILNQPRHLLTVPEHKHFQYNSTLLVYDEYYTQVC